MYALPSLSASSFDILPGPFILLLLIPLLPLTLFSLGARPPGVDSFPFLTDELWRTTALLGMAVTIGLCVGVYPDSLQSMVTWVRDGRMTAVGISKPDWLSWGAGRGASKAALARQIAHSRKPSFERIAANHIAALRYYHPRLYNASRPKLFSVVGLGLTVTLVIIVVLGKVLREVYESESRPAPRQAKGAETKKQEEPSEWVQREYRKRKEEKPDETKTRFKAEEAALAEKYKKRRKDAEAADKADKPGKDKDKGKSKGKGEKGKKTKVEEHEKSMMKKSEERRKDVKELKMMLEAKKIEPIGLDKDPGWMVKDQSKDKDKDEDKDAGKDKGKGKKEDAEAKKEKDQGSKTKTTVGDRIRTALLGKTMAESMKRDKKKRQEAQGTGGTAAASVPPAFTPAAVPQRGPGWEVADDHTAAQVALAKSAGDAEALAKGMGK